MTWGVVHERIIPTYALCSIKIFHQCLSQSLRTLLPRWSVFLYTQNKTTPFIQQSPPPLLTNVIHYYIRPSMRNMSSSSINGGVKRLRWLLHPVAVWSTLVSCAKSETWMSHTRCVVALLHSAGISVPGNVLTRQLCTKRNTNRP